MRKRCFHLAWCAVVAAVLILCGFSHAAPAVANRWTVAYEPARVVNGTPVLFQVTAPVGATALSGQWLEHEISFTFDASRKAWFGLAGASLETKPGAYPLELEAKMSSGKSVTYKQAIKVVRQRYPRVTLTVAGKYTAPDPEQLRVVAHDKEVKAEAFKTLTADREWKGSFQAPVKAEISDVFGVQRVFNGVVKSTHQGLDFRVPPGTAVSAVNSGTVLLARSLYFEGNCIVLDHGQGLLTLYLHLSEVRVKEGEQVAKGQEIGLSGGTGRATGPHLHLAVRWQGVYLNPAGLLSLRVP